MRRMVEKRWLAFVLALSILLASTASFPSRSYGDGRWDPQTIGDGSGGGGSVAAGDPDGPAGPNKRAPVGGRPVRSSILSAAPSVGDGGTALRVWMWRIQVALLSLRARGLRF